MIVEYLLFYNRRKLIFVFSQLWLLPPNVDKPVSRDNEMLITVFGYNDCRIFVVLRYKLIFIQLSSRLRQCRIVEYLYYFKSRPLRQSSSPYFLSKFPTYKDRLQYHEFPKNQDKPPRGNIGLVVERVTKIVTTP